MKRQTPTLPYKEIIKLKFQVGGESIEVASKPGLPGWDHLSPATLLIGEKITLPPDSKVYYLGCGNGAGTVMVGKQLTSGELWLHDFNHIAMQVIAETIKLNQISTALLLTDIHLPPELVNNFDIVIIELPKGRKLAQRWLAQAFLALKTGGVLYIGGANRQGILPVIHDAGMLFGEAVVSGYKKGSRLVRVQKTNQEFPVTGWWQTPGIAPGTWHTFTLQLRSGSFEINSLPGIFSYDRLDEGTQLMLDSLPDLDNLKVMDLGCGFGALGLEAARSGATLVDMVDANLLAVAAAQKNIERLGLTNTRALASDVLSAVPGRKYDLIVSNPPFHTGGDVDYQVANAFIEQSYAALEQDGRLFIVANRFIRYEKIMELHFKQAFQVVQSPRFHVLCGVK